MPRKKKIQEPSLNEGVIGQYEEVQIYKAGEPLFGCKHQNQREENGQNVCNDCGQIIN